MSVLHILFVLTNTAKLGPRKRATGYFFAEVAHPFEVFDGAGVAIDFVSPKGGAIPEDAYDEKDSADRAFKQSLAYRRDEPKPKTLRGRRERLRRDLFPGRSRTHGRHRD